MVANQSVDYIDAVRVQKEVVNQNAHDFEVTRTEDKQE
jgi:hypothetical protein